MFKLSFQKFITAGGGIGLLAGGGGGILWSYQHFTLPSSIIVYAAETDSKSSPPVITSGSSSNEDKYAALYAEPEPSSSQRKSTIKDEIPAIARTRTELEEAIAKCRKEITPIKDTIKRYTNNTIDFTIRTSNATVEQVNYIKHKAPKEIQIATIVGSGLVGLLLSFRRGMFRKLIYTSAGAGIASWIIYPNETKSFAKSSATFIKKYTLVAYHFVVGAQPSPKDK